MFCIFYNCVLGINETAVADERRYFVTPEIRHRGKSYIFECIYTYFVHVYTIYILYMHYVHISIF